MKVLIVSKALVVAAYRHKLEALSRLGVDVVAVVPPEWREGGGQQRFEATEGETCRVIVSPIRWNGHFHLHYYPRLPGIICAEKPDLVHMDEEAYNLATFLGVVESQRSVIPSIFFTWQNIRRRYPLPFSTMERYVYRNVNGALAGNAEARDVLRAKGFGGPAVVVPQFGVDTGVFIPVPRQSGSFTVGYLNRLVEGKAPLLAIDAFSRLPADFRLRIVGDGPLRNQVEHAVIERGLTGRVRIDGRIPSLQMPSLLSSLDAVILPSITTPSWKEQFGRVLIEAMACGVPVVGSDSGEIPNVIGEAGIVVPEGDERALAEALQRLHDDSRLGRALARKGRTRVLAHFSNERIAELTLHAYERMLGH